MESKLKKTAEEIAAKVRVLEARLKVVQIDNQLLREKLEQAEFERDEWRKVAEQ